MQLPKFNLTPGYDTMTKDGIDARRRMIAGLARQQQPKTALEGVGRIAQALFARHAGAKLDEREGVLRKEADDMFQQAIGGFAGGMPAQTGTGFVPQGGGGSDMLTGGSGDDMLMPNVPVPGPQPLGRGGSEQMPQTLLPGAPQGDMASYVRNGLIERGLQPHIADGFVMNFQDESGLNPGINEIEPLVPGSRGGFGLSQWTGPRRRNLEAFAQSRGVPVGDADMQMDFLMDELRGPEAAAAQAIMAAPDAGQAAAAIVNKFLRPAEEHRARRERRYLGGQAPVTGGGGTPSLTGQSAGDTLQNFNPAQVMALAQAASNPMMTDGQRMVLGALLQRQLAPAQQVQPVSIEGKLVNPQTGEILGDYRDPPERAIIQGADGRNYYQDTGEAVLPNVQVPSEIAALEQRAVAAGLEPGTPAYQEFMMRDGDMGDDTPAAFRALQLRAQAAGLQPGTPEYNQFMIDAGNQSGMAIDIGPDGTISFREGAGAGSSSKPFTDAQAKSITYATRAEGALQDLDEVDEILTSRADLIAENVPFGLAREMQNPDYQRARQAADEFMMAILRKDTGAAITSDEMTLYGGVYLPQPGDSPEVIRQKRVARKRALDALKAGMSPAEMLAQEQALAQGGTSTSPPTTTTPPAAGGMPEGVNPELWQGLSEQDRQLLQRGWDTWTPEQKAMWQ